MYMRAKDFVIWILIEITAIFIVKLIVIRDIKISLFIFITVYDIFVSHPG